MNPKAKVMIPNILTLSRLILTPIIIILGIIKNYKLALILVVIACITDMFDGKLARKWNTVTKTGAKLDTISDKIFAIGLTTCLIRKFKIFIPLMILEIIIGLFNLFAYFKTNKVKSLMIGKIKTVFLFTTVSIGFLNIFIKELYSIVLGLGFATLNIQVLSLISYIVNFYDNIKNKELEVAIVKDKEDTRTKIFNIEEHEVREEEINSDTKVLNHIKDIFLEKD